VPHLVVETQRLVEGVNRSSLVPCNIRCNANGIVTKLLAIAGQLLLF
jgi:hypothetical protein